MLLAGRAHGAIHGQIHRHPAGTTDALFATAVELAKRIIATTRDEAAMVVQLRVAFMLCPTCKAQPLPEGPVKHFFELDSLTDRVYLSDRIFPEIFQLGARELLWVGVRPGTALRYECAPTPPACQCCM